MTRDDVAKAWKTTLGNVDRSQELSPADSELGLPTCEINFATLDATGGTVNLTALPPTGFGSKKSALAAKIEAVPDVGDDAFITDQNDLFFTFRQRGYKIFLDIDDSVQNERIVRPGEIALAKLLVAKM